MDDRRLFQVARPVLAVEIRNRSRLRAVDEGAYRVEEIDLQLPTPNDEKCKERKGQDRKPRKDKMNAEFGSQQGGCNARESVAIE